MPARNRSRGKPRIRLHFLGATRQVTGSLHFFEFTSEDGTSDLFFVDSGLNQENEAQNLENRLPKGVKWSDVKFGIFTHTHLDHIGYLPRAYNEGFRGPVYGTAPTCDFSGISLPDSGFLQEEDARRANARAKRQAERPAAEPQDGRKPRPRSKRAPKLVVPLYTQAEAEACLHLLKPVAYDTPIQLADGIVARFSHASHLLGAAVVTLDIGQGSHKRTIALSGDVGRPSYPVLKDLAPVPHADYVVCEGTYGDRAHEAYDRQAHLAEMVKAAYERAKKPGPNGCGVIIIPAFAIGRVQSVLFDLRELMLAGRIPTIPVIVDSPMAIKANAVYRRYPELYAGRAAQLAARGTDPFRTPEFAEVADYKDSQHLLQPASKPVIIIGSSGMATGGRITNHLKYRLPGANNTVIFVGYQANGTMGRMLTQEEKPETVRMFGEDVPVRATILHTGGYSGHGDYNDIIRWLRGFNVKPKKLFLVHGDEEALLALADRVKRSLGIDVVVPSHREYHDLI